MQDDTGLKFKEAHYIDVNGEPQVILARQLDSKDERERADANDLYDKDGLVKLCLRDGDGTASEKRHHFAIVSGTTEPRVYTGDRSDAHNARVRELLRFAKILGANPWRFERVAGASEKNVPFLRLPPYQWGGEVTRMSGPSEYIRHDIFAAYLELISTRLRPMIAIEVVDTHFPEKEAFEAMMEYSARAPYIVLFDIVAKPNQFVMLHGRECSLRYFHRTFMIKDGSVWKGDVARRDIQTTERLAIEVRDVVAKM